MTPHADYIFPQTLHTGQVRELKVRGMSEDGSQEVLVVYSDAVIARIDGVAMAALLQARHTAPFSDTPRARSPPLAPPCACGRMWRGKGGLCGAYGRRA